ncbi:MAG: hypothetical protein P8186_06595 [Anaerolineae bacterium]
MKDVLGQLTWSISDMGQAIEALGRESGLQAHTAEAPPPPEGLVQASGAQLGHWVELTAGWLGFEAEPVQVPYPEVAKLVRRAGPALLRLPGGENPRFLAILGSGRRMVPVLGPDLGRHRLSVETIRAALCSDIESLLVTEIDRLLDKAGVPDRRRNRARKAILRERLGAARISGGWLLRPLPGAHFWHQVRFARLTPYFFFFTGAHAVQYVFWLLSWWIIGRGAAKLGRGRFAQAAPPLRGAAPQSGGSAASRSRAISRAGHRIRSSRVPGSERWLPGASGGNRTGAGSAGAWRGRCW